MIEVTNCYCEINLDTGDFTKILKGMNEAGFASVIWQSKAAFLSAAGITVFDKDILDWIGYYNVSWAGSFIYRADLFVESEDIVYIIDGPSGSNDRDRGVEIGVISENSIAAGKLLEKYVRQFEASLKAKIDGRKVRHMTLKWYEFPNNARIDTHVSFYKNFTYSLMNEAEIHAASQLRDVESRQVLRKIALHDTAKIFDIKGDQRDAVMETVRKLISWKLVESKFIITCKKNSQAIALVQSKEEITGPGSNGLHCPHCSRSFIEESINESFILSELGRKMNEGSHWMTVLLTDTLLESGVPEKSIIWNITQDSEEVDCVVEFFGKVWIFELKDRNFESGDAHPLSYRAVKFKADKVIIFTTANVSKEARKVFDDVAMQSRNGPGDIPLYIEGISSLKPTIGTLIKNETLMRVRDKAKQISRFAGIDCSPIFSALFGKYIHQHKDGTKEGINIFRY